jgi:hypothetical protein
MKLAIPHGLKRPRVIDVVVAAAVAWVTVLDAWSNLPGTRQADAVTYLLVAASIASLLVRRRWSVPVALVCMAKSLLRAYAPTNGSFFLLS